MSKWKKDSHFVQTGENARKRSLWEEIKRNKFFYLIPIPGIITLILFSYLPMAGIYMAFENYSYEGGLFGSEFVGLRNFSGDDPEGCRGGHAWGDPKRALSESDADNYDIP